MLKINTIKLNKTILYVIIGSDYYECKRSFQMIFITQQNKQFGLKNKLNRNFVMILS